MAASVLVDAGFVVALLSRRDFHHAWAAAQTTTHAPPWRSCEAALSEAIHLPGAASAPALHALLRRRLFFRIYRRHSRQVVPCVMPD